MDRALVERDAQHRGSNLPIRFRIPHSAFRILLVGALAACGGSDGPRVTVTVPPGSTLDAAVDSLAANHVIAHPGTFRLYARLRGLAGSLKSGVYLLRQDESWSDVVAALERGRGVEQRFTVREGLRLAEVADLAQAALGIPRDSLLTAAQDRGLLAGLGLPERTTSVEGYLFPTTYLLPLHLGARELVGHDADQLPPPQVQRQQVRRGEEVSLDAGRALGEAEPGEQAAVLCRREERITRNAERRLGEVRHLGEAQALAHGKALLHPAAALERRHDVTPRLVLPQQVHAALQRPREAAEPGIQRERTGMADDAVRGERIHGGVECGSRRDGH